LVSADYGRELFATNCASCHGADGLKPNPGIPMLHDPAVLAYAPDSYYRDIIERGRPGTQMPAWKGVLTPTQISSLISYFRGWSRPTPMPTAAEMAAGDAAAGRRVFEGRCAACHGREGQGGVGNSLNSPSFQAIASDNFLRDTIVRGREHTAMPASFGLSAKDVADVVAFIRTWRKPAPAWGEVKSLMASASAARGAAAFAAHCAGCHGAQGKGGIGSRLNDDTFLTRLDDHSFYRIITEGRPGTAMPKWSFLPARDVSDIIALLRSWQKSPSVAGSSWTARGDAEAGAKLFHANCVRCHGEGGRGDTGAQNGNPYFLGQVSDDFLRATIAYGKPGTEMKGFMNRARDPFTLAQVEDIIAYLRGLQANPSPEDLQNTFSWADPDSGADVFKTQANCARCHGAHGEGGIGPSIGNPAFL
ncbi:MAG: c-type cytochrome, partial [Elusimicrobia bacterium]|nr:c-type cytochrome [Elusimicrobiota bacterium]